MHSIGVITLQKKTQNLPDGEIKPEISVVRARLYTEKQKLHISKYTLYLIKQKNDEQTLSSENNRQDGAGMMARQLRIFGALAEEFPALT